MTTKAVAKKKTDFLEQFLISLEFTTDTPPPHCFFKICQKNKHWICVVLLPIIKHIRINEFASEQEEKSWNYFQKISKYNPKTISEIGNKKIGILRPSEKDQKT